MKRNSSPDVRVDTQEEEPPSEPAPASFNGRLDLSSFTFTPNSASPRRTPRSSEPKSPAPQPTNQVTSKRSNAHLTSSPSPRKKSRSPSSYAPPSTYSHLLPLPDVLSPGLICVFIGLNPGIETSRSQHAYAHPSNLFWKLLYSSGCTTRRLSPTEDGNLPRLFQLGNTNIVSRPTRNGSELSKKEMDESVGVLEEKIRNCKPEAVCLVGKSIWESVYRVWNKKKIEKGEFEYGWQEGVTMGAEEGWKGARVFVACSTSGLSASLKPDEKERIWKMLGSWVEERRRVRAGEKVEIVLDDELKIKKTT